MSKLIKIILCMILIFFSLIIFLDYSFNVRNLFTENNVEITYKINETTSKSNFLNILSNISERNNVIVAYSMQDLNAKYYVIENNLTKDYFNGDYINANYNSSSTKKTIPYSNFYRNIEVYPFQESDEINIETGYLILSGEKADITNFEMDFQNYASITQTRKITLEPSEYYVDTFPVILFMYVFLFIVVFIVSSRSEREYSILYMEGYSKNQIVFKKIFSSYIVILLTYTLLMFLVFVFSVVTYNKTFILFYWKYISLFSLITLIIFTVFNFIVIGKFDKRNLKINVSTKLSEILLYIVKIATLTFILTFVFTVISLYGKLENQLGQAKAIDKIPNYGRFFTNDDGSFSSGISEYNKKYLNLYLDTYEEFKGIITAPIGCNYVQEKSTNEICNFVVSPQYLNFFDQDINTRNDMVNLIVKEGAEVDLKKISQAIGISSEKINIIYLQHESEIPFLNSQNQIVQSDYNYLILLDEYLIENSKSILENAVFLIQDYYIELNESHNSEKFLKYVSENGLSEQIRTISYLKDLNINAISNIKKSTRVYMILLLSSLVLFIIVLLCIIYINIKKDSRFNSILLIEGYDFYQIKKKFLIINSIIYFLVFFINFKKGLFISFLIIFILYLFDIIVTKKIFNHFISKNIIGNIKGEL